MAKDIIKDLPKSKIWGWVALGSVAVGATLVFLAIRETQNAKLAQAKKEEAESEQEKTEEKVEEIVQQFSGAIGRGRSGRLL